MKAFAYVNPKDLKGASTALSGDRKQAVLMAGGIDLLGELKERLIEPERVVNLKSVPGLDTMKAEGTGLALGALTTLTAIADHPAIQRDYTALAEAARSVGSVQIRNVGTLGGNLCQRPRCWYFRSPEHVCLKKGGSVCYAAVGLNRYNAILGGGPAFYVHPSDCAPALLALKGSVRVSGPQGERTVPLDRFFVLPADKLTGENMLEPQEIVVEVTVPAPAPGTRSTYLKLKEKDSMDFALSAAAAALQLGSDGTVQSCRLVLGGVAPIPWVVPEAEEMLKGQKVTESLAAQVADKALEGASPLAHNGYKVPVTKAVIKRALMAAAAERRA